MWTDIPVDNLLTIHTAHEIKDTFSRHLRTSEEFKELECQNRNVILQFLWHSSLNVCLELKCGNYEMWNVLHQQQHKSYIYQLFVECKQLTSEYKSNKINMVRKVNYIL